MILLPVRATAQLLVQRQGTKMAERSPEYDLVARQIVDATIHSTLGSGPLESVYEQHLGIALEVRETLFVRQAGLLV